MRLALLVTLLEVCACGTAGLRRNADDDDDIATDGDADADGDTDADGDADADGDCAGVGTDCYEGPEGTAGRGLCTWGTWACEGGRLACRDWIGPSAELCNGADDDCDGVTDGEAASSGLLCNTGLLGECRLGRMACVDGAEVCDPDHDPGVEACNNTAVDDDCNGVLDDVPEVGTACDTGLAGICADGAFACDGPDLVCESLPELQGEAEACGTGIDEDCDGFVDEADCVSCLNPAGGPLVADNGTGADERYCYDADDTDQDRALKACESHFGEGACCVIQGGYNGQQYGECGADGGAGSIHWHWDNHPAGHCDPNYVIGDVVSPGWCGVILGSFLN